MQGAPPHAGIQ